MKRLLVLGLAVLAACDDFDELTEAALDAGTMAGGSAGGSAGVDGGVCAASCPPVGAGCMKACQTLEFDGGGMPLSGPLLALATTGDRLFLALAGQLDGGATGFSVLHLVDGGVRTTSEFSDGFLDLDARFNEAALATHSAIWTFDGTSWTSVAAPTGSAGGGCRSVNVTGSSSMPSRRAYCRSALGTFDVTSLQLGIWGMTSTLPFPAPPTWKARPAGDSDVLVGQEAGSGWFAFVPSNGGGMALPLAGATSSAVASNDTREPWVAAAVASHVVLWPATGTPAGFPGPSIPNSRSITGAFTVDALAAVGMPPSSDLALALTSATAQMGMVQGQEVPLLAGTTVLLLRGPDVRVLPLGTGVRGVFLGFGAVGPELVLHLGLACDANGSLACRGAGGPRTRWVMLPVRG